MKNEFLIKKEAFNVWFLENNPNPFQIYDYLSQFQPKSVSESELEDEILNWQRVWMDVKGTDEKDRKNYFIRAYGIDANMRYSLARRLLKKFSFPKPLSDNEIEEAAKKFDEQYGPEFGQCNGRAFKAGYKAALKRGG